MKHFRWLIPIISFTILFLGMTVITKARSAKSTFSIAFNEWVGYAPFFLAKEKGFFGNLPVDLHFVELVGNRRAGLYAGRFQMICETIDMFETNRDVSGYSGKIGFAIDESYGGDGILATNQIKNITNLKNKMVVAEPGLPAYFMLQMLLHKKGMTLKDIQLQNMTSADAATAFIAGKADVAGTFEPYLSQALSKRKDAHLLASSKDFPGLILDVGILGESALSTHHDEVKQVYLGWCKAIDYFHSHRAESIAIMARAFKMTPQEFEKTIGGLRYYGHKSNQVLFGTTKKRGTIYKTFKTNGEVLHANGLTKIVDPASIHIDATIVNNNK